MKTQQPRARLRAAAYLCGLAFAVWCGAVPGRASAVQFDLSLTTSRGCQEDGDNPVFAVGETINVTFRVGSNVVQSASVALFDFLADGRVGVISFGQVLTNRSFVFAARVGPPIGLETLVLQADAFGVQRTRKPCSFTVVAAGTPAASGTPTPTRTPFSTHTPKPTHTPIPTVPTTVTPGGTLRAELRTDRGCIETGDDATFAIGERIKIFYALKSNTFGLADATLFDFLPNNIIKVIEFGLIPTNVNFVLIGNVGPPNGNRTLRLRGRASGVPNAIANCSFHVGGTPPPTRTATPRPPTRTPTATKTRTVATPCTGACTNPDMVTLTDIIKVAQIAAGELPLSACPAADRDGNGMVELAEVLAAVNNAINGC